MIQRIQSVYLLIAAILLLCFGFFPLAEVQDMAGVVLASAGGMSAMNTFIPALAAALIAVLAIFMYRNRKAQMRLCLMLLLLSVVLSAGTAYGIFSQASALSAQVAWKPGIALPLISGVLFYLAWRGIRNDDRLVRSADRLR
jgi:hypothetical protein